MTEQVRLGDVAKIDVGFPFKSANFSEDTQHLRLLRGDNIAQGRLRWAGARHWPTESTYDPKYELARGDVVLAMDRPWIEAGLKQASVRDDDLPALLVQRVARLRAIDGMLDQRYLAAIVSSGAFSDYLVSVQTGSAVPHISGRQIAEYRFKLPPIREQRAIAEVLGALNDKIAANTRLAGTADDYLHTRFQSLPHDVTIPLSSAAQFVNGKAFTKGASGSGRVVIRIAELNSGIGGSTVFSDAVVDDKHLARPGDVLFAWSGSLTLARWFRDEAIVNQHIFKVIPNTGFPKWLVYLLIDQKLASFKAIAADKATTMGHIQRRHLDEQVHLPTAALVEDIDAEMEAVWSRALLAEQENLTLAALRDALLPQLMSGKLRVLDADAEASEALS